jgi:hypothetical protein
MTAAKKVLIICQLDGYANQLKPLQIQRFLQERGHDVRVVDTYLLSRASSDPSAVGHRLPAPAPRRLALYTTEVLSALMTRHAGGGRRFLSYYALRADHRLRRGILRSALPLDEFDLIICEDPYDAGVLTSAGSAHTLYDCPTPWADEVFYEGRLTGRQHRRFRRLEAQLFDGVDHLAFHWDSYARYAIEHYGINGHNLLTLNFGCTPSPCRARFADPPRIVYLGSLSSRFIDLPLLSRLSRLYPRIDVYGGPPPDPRLGLNYRGYAWPEVLQAYQIGLITCTQDELRRDGFSAKHLQYLAHGLPVLVPAWRRHLEELSGSVAYEESTFLAAVTALSDEGEWQRTSDQAYDQARRLAWDETLRPLEALLSPTAGR